MIDLFNEAQSCIWSVINIEEAESKIVVCIRSKTYNEYTEQCSIYWTSLLVQYLACCCCCHRCYTVLQSWQSIVKNCCRHAWSDCLIFAVPPGAAVLLFSSFGTVLTFHVVFVVVFSNRGHLKIYYYFFLDIEKLLIFFQCHFNILSSRISSKKSEASTANLIPVNMSKRLLKVRIECIPVTMCLGTKLYASHADISARFTTAPGIHFDSPPPQ